MYVKSVYAERRLYFVFMYLSNIIHRLQTFVYVIFYLIDGWPFINCLALEMYVYDQRCKTSWKNFSMIMGCFMGLSLLPASSPLYY